MKKIMGIIPARGGSKGIPGKNIKPFAGKPLIAWTIEAALESKILDRLIVSTDDNNIKRAAEAYGAEVPFIRPKELATDTATSFSVVDHVLDWHVREEQYKPDHVMLLQPTSPLRTVEDIIHSERLATGAVAAVVSVTEPHDHPYLAQIIRPDGTLGAFIPESVGCTRRQDFPRVFTLNGAIYLCSVESLKREKTFTPERTVPYIMPPERSLDIDTPCDFFLAEKVMQEKINRHL